MGCSLRAFPQGSAVGDKPAGDTGPLFKVPVSQSATGKQGCRHKDDFILPVELLHGDCHPPRPVPLARAGSLLWQNNKFSQPPKAGRRSSAFLRIHKVLC